LQLKTLLFAISRMTTARRDRFLKVPLLTSVSPATEVSHYGH